MAQAIIHHLLDVDNSAGQSFCKHGAVVKEPVKAGCLEQVWGTFGSDFFLPRRKTTSGNESATPARTIARELLLLDRNYSSPAFSNAVMEILMVIWKWEQRGSSHRVATPHPHPGPVPRKSYTCNSQCRAVKHLLVDSTFFLRSIGVGVSRNYEADKIDVVLVIYYN